MARSSSVVRHLAALAATALCLTAVPAIVGSAVAAPPEGGNLPSCNGIEPNSGSENTLKSLEPGSDLSPGGTAVFTITYPQTGVEDGDVFEFIDCFGVVERDGDKVDMVRVIDQFAASVSNAVDYTFEYTVVIPEDVPIGAEVCNWVRTTAGPSASPASNRKADICFAVGGSLRIEKEDSEGNPLAGAKFEVECDDSAELPDVVIDGLEDANGDPVTTNPATGWLNSGAIEINGEEDSECTVTELQAPEGYVTPVGDDAVHVYEIGRGDAPETFTIVNEPVPPTYDAVTTTASATGTFDRTTSWTLAKTVDDAAHAGEAGEDAGSSEWAVTATKSVSAPSNHAVTGTTDVANPNDIDAEGTVSVTVGGVAGTVDCDPEAEGSQAGLTVPAGDSASCSFSGPATGEDDQVVATFTSLTEGVAGDDVTIGVDDWTPNDLGPQSLTVDDDRAPADVLPATVGATTTWTYDETFSCPSDESLYSEDGTLATTVTNTATATGVDPASASVVVNCTLVEVLVNNPTTPPPTTPVVLPFVPDAAAPAALPRTGTDYLLPMLALGLGGLLIGALLVGAGRRRNA